MRSAARARDSRDFTVPASNVEGASDLSVVKTVQLVEYERGAIRWCQISESAVDRSSQAAVLLPGIRAIGASVTSCAGSVTTKPAHVDATQ